MTHNKKLAIWTLSLFVGGIVGYAINSTQSLNQTLEGNAVKSNIATQSLQIEQSASVDSAVLAQAIANAPDDADTVDVMDKNGNKVTAPIPKKVFILEEGSTPPSSQLLHSNNGSAWSIFSSFTGSARTYGSMLYYKSKLWVIGGYNGAGTNDVWSNDGTTWNLVTSTIPFPNRTGQVYARYNNKMWIMGGNSQSGPTTITNYNDVYWSTNGSSWNSVVGVPWSPRSFRAQITFNNKLWLFGGYYTSFGVTPVFYNDVWSFDGINWSQTTTSAPWSGSVQAAYSLNGVMYVVADGPNGASSEVYSSSDGVIWSTVTLNSGLPGNYNYAYFVLNGKMWTVGGTQNEHDYDGIWSSPNGAMWTYNGSSALVAGERYPAVITPLTFGQKPDLVVDSVTAPVSIPVSSFTNSGLVVPISVTIKNIGTASAVIPANMQMALTLGASSSGWGGSGLKLFTIGTSVPPITFPYTLAPGQTLIVNTNSLMNQFTSPTITPATYYINAKVDEVGSSSVVPPVTPVNSVIESNETNNFGGSKAVTVTP